MGREGLGPSSEADRREWARIAYKAYLKKTTELLWSIDENALVYHNGSDKKGRHDLYPYWTHFEIESLPTGGWGYNHFPVNARYFTMLPETNVVSMTGKFHKSWGEFGGFKNPVALRYEMAQIMSLGCQACVGDQLHPRGEMDMATYRIVGEAYRDVEEREEWLTGARPVADVAVVSPSAVRRETVQEDEAESGACRMLMEMHIPHVVLDETMDLSPYALLVLPDRVPVGETLAGKLRSYLQAGGAVLLSGSSGLDSQGRDFVVDTGARYRGPSPWDVEYILAGDALAVDLVRSPFLVYQSGVVLEPGQAEVLAETWRPYFNRTYEHFCSHRNTPPEEPAGWPAVVRKGKIVQIAQPIFAVYNRQGMQLHRDLVRNCIRLIYEDPLLEAELPSCGRVSVMEQAAQARRIVHLLYANPIRRGETEVIEDVVPLHDVEVSLRSDGEPKSVYLAPSREQLPWRHEGGRVHFTVPRLELAAMVVVEW
jgi:hypothetical protein